MENRIYNQHGAHDRVVLDHLRRLGVDDLIERAHRVLVEAGYESRDSQAYLTDVLACVAGEYRIRAGIEFRRRERASVSDRSREAVETQSGSMRQHESAVGAAETPALSTHPSGQPSEAEGN